jgi:hypothetical protein
VCLQFLITGLHLDLVKKFGAKVHVSTKTSKFTIFKPLAIDHGIESPVPLTGSKMAPNDSRRIPSTMVEVRLMVFMSEAECRRQYGSNKATETLVGHHVLSCKKLSTSSGKTSQTLVTIEFDLGEDKKKIITTGLRNVKASVVENLVDNGGGCTFTGSMLSRWHANAPPSSINQAPGPNRCYQGSSIPISGTIVTGELTDSSNGDGGINRQSTNTAAMATSTMAAPPPPQGPLPAVVVHDTPWYDDDQATKLPIKWSFPFKNWHATNAMSVHFGVGSDTEEIFAARLFLDDVSPRANHSHDTTYQLLAAHSPEKGDVKGGVDLVVWHNDLGDTFPVQESTRSLEYDSSHSICSGPQVWQQDWLLSELA